MPQMQQQEYRRQTGPKELLPPVRIQRSERDFQDGGEIGIKEGVNIVNIMTQYRHGDVFLREVAQLPDKAKLEARKGDIILAKGEMTGHAHRIKSSQARVMVAERIRYLVLDLPVILDHEEHGKITIPKGIFEVVQQREYIPGDVRNVAD